MMYDGLIHFLAHSESYKNLRFPSSSHWIKFPVSWKMLTSALLTLVALSQFVVGQTASPVPNTPHCLVTCSMQFCPTSQLQCLCVDKVSNITICALDTCDSADQATAEIIAAQVCGTVFWLRSLIASGYHELKYQHNHNHKYRCQLYQHQHQY